MSDRPVVEIEFLRENAPFRPGERISVSSDRAAVYERANVARRVQARAASEGSSRAASDDTSRAACEETFPSPGASLAGKRAVVRDYVKKA